MNFQKHLNNIPRKVNKAIGLLHKLQALLPRQSLVTVYKAFLRPSLDYGDIICDQTYNDSFHQKMGSIQYNTALAITGGITGTSREKLYQLLGLESLRIFQNIKGQSAECLFRLLPNISNAYNTRTNDKIPLFSGKHNFVINSFFPSTVIE